MRTRRIGCAGWIFIIIGSIFALVLAITLISLAIDKQKDKQREEERALQEAAELAAAEAYDDSLAQLRDDGYVCPETADKAVSVYYSEAEYLSEDEENYIGLFSRRFLPEELIAESVDEIRYIVSVTHEDRKVNSYFGGGNAYKRFYIVQVTDLLTGNVLVDNTFSGGEPPMSIPMESSSGWGSFPKDEEITEWLPEAIAEGVRLQEEEAAQEAFNDAMSVLLESGYTCSHTADKAVTLFVETNGDVTTENFTTEYIPEDLQTEQPEEVRWLVRCESNLVSVGLYAFYGSANQRRLDVEIIDLSTGRSLSEAHFLGPKPPESVSSIAEATGDYPDPADITEWITSVICK